MLKVENLKNKDIKSPSNWSECVKMLRLHLKESTFELIYYGNLFNRSSGGIDWSLILGVSICWVIRKIGRGLALHYFGK